MKDNDVEHDDNGYVMEDRSPGGALLLIAFAVGGFALVAVGTAAWQLAVGLVLAGAGTIGAYRLLRKRS